LLLAFTAWRYWRACFTLGQDQFDAIYDKLSDAAAPLRRLIGRITARIGGGAGA